MLNFTNKPMFEIIDILKNNLQNIDEKKIVEFTIFNPDTVTSTYSGNMIKIDEKKYLYRSYKSWLDLAQSLHCRILTPIIQSKYIVLMRFEKLHKDNSFHLKIVDKEEKYGSESIFSKIYKNEESSFIFHYKKALENVHIDTRIRILNLGVNSGDEFEIIQKYAKNFKQLELVGIDYCTSAIQSAQERFKDENNITFYTHDINNLSSLELGEFDLIISIGTLQSSNLEFNKLLISIVQNQLKKDGAIILGFPNCRWVDGEMIYGAKVKNYAFSEMGLLYKDVIFSKKYLQQKKFRVTITGKDYIFITGTSIR